MADLIDVDSRIIKIAESIRSAWVCALRGETRLEIDCDSTLLGKRRGKKPVVPKTITRRVPDALLRWLAGQGEQANLVLLNYSVDLLLGSAVPVFHDAIWTDEATVRFIFRLAPGPA